MLGRQMVRRVLTLGTRSNKAQSGFLHAVCSSPPVAMQSRTAFCSIVDKNHEVTDCRVVDLTNTGSAANPVFRVAPLNSKESQDFLYGWFKRCTGRTKGKLGFVPLAYGRKMLVEHFVGVAKITFADLCREELCQDDFEILGQTFHTILLQDVPYLTAEQYYEARLLTTFIDFMYDHHTRLVMTTEVESTKIFDGLAGLRTFASINGPSAFPVDQLQEQLPPSYLNNVQQEIAYIRGGKSVQPHNAEPSKDPGHAGIEIRLRRIKEVQMATAMASSQESGFAAIRASSRLQEMQRASYLEEHWKNLQIQESLDEYREVYLADYRM